MLARANRLTRADEFRHTLRRGRKHVAASTVITVLPTAQDCPVRFGFIVAKTVGNAVVRNRLRRRMRAAAFELVRAGLTGADVVVRALPNRPEVHVVDYQDQFRRAVSKR